MINSGPRSISRRKLTQIPPKGGKTPRAPTQRNAAGLSLKAQRQLKKVISEYISALSFEGVNFKADDSSKAKQMGGSYFLNDTIYLDPLFLVGVEDRPLAFTLAHELGHRWFGEEFIKIFLKTLDAESEVEAVREADELIAHDENYADVYGIRKLFESGWNQNEMAKCLSDLKSHLESYSKRIGRGAGSPRELNDWLSRIQIGCYFLWLDFQISHADRFTQSKPSLP